MPGLKRTSTGVKGLDSLLGGGLPLHSVVTILGPPGAGKTTFCRQFIHTSLEKGNCCVYVTTTEPVEHIKEQMKSMGWDVKKFEDKLIFIDCYSWRVPKSKPSGQNVHTIPSLSDLNELNRVLREIVSKKTCPMHFVIDSLSDLIMYSNPESVFKFMQLFTGLVKSGDNCALIVLEEGLHEPRVYATVNYVTDGTIELRIKDARRLLRIARMMDTMHPLKWVAFTISGRGVEVEIEKFFG